ncbi:proline--tRNA ligase [Marinicauda salina]|uniref:Proline--tRNA ligase n=1 Tax=Marinicauda salina TaxID=2135793 RepID=A0A2U2BVW7_9PROT|nr:aminoacyl--tRNA ligase-related protein [Marinicauda salina]PWE18137.1 proline--tRNA ligase [Marinicauda salina]
MSKNALDVRQEDNFADWYQAAVRGGELAEESGVRGCMIIKPWGFGIWERLKSAMDAEIVAHGVENCYFPLLIPLKHFEQEAQHVEGFAKEMAVVTHHRLSMIDGKLQPDPDAKLEEPLIIRPTSETIIGSAMSRWIRSYRDLPLKLNQWANVMRWEMRPRLFLRTSEFLWQEGHTAHATREEAEAETAAMLAMYKKVVEETLALPVIDGVKPEHERFPGAVDTLSIEAMMRDGKALQAGTSHYLGTNFAKAQNIQFQDSDGEWRYAHTTSWGSSTRLVGALVMTHGDNDGLRLPPRAAPSQIVIIPMLKGGDQDEALLEYCRDLARRLSAGQAFGEPLRVRLDDRPERAQIKRWDWVRKGAPVICEIGARDMEHGAVSFLRRDQLRLDGGKPNVRSEPIDMFADNAGDICENIQQALYDQAETFLRSNIVDDFASLEEVEALFAEDGAKWARIPWARPTGAELDAFVERLKASKLTVRNAPFEQGEVAGKCLVTGREAVENILIARAY